MLNLKSVPLWWKEKKLQKIIRKLEFLPYCYLFQLIFWWVYIPYKQISLIFINNLHKIYIYIYLLDTLQVAKNDNNDSTDHRTMIHLNLPNEENGHVEKIGCRTLESILTVGPLARNQPPLHHQRDVRSPPSLVALSQLSSPRSLSLSRGDQSDGGGGGLSILLSLPLSPPLVALHSVRSEWV